MSTDERLHNIEELLAELKKSDDPTRKFRVGSLLHVSMSLLSAVFLAGIIYATMRGNIAATTTELTRVTVVQDANVGRIATLEQSRAGIEATVQYLKDGQARIEQKLDDVLRGRGAR